VDLLRIRVANIRACGSTPNTKSVEGYLASSSFCTVRCDIRQGGVLLPHIFAVHIYEVIIEYC
jgi:hypothetical protein